jgi:hypothetical protein
MKPEDLHDATLIDMHFDWGSGVLRISFATGLVGMPRVQLMLENVYAAKFYREFPWGSSVSINKIDITETNGRKRCEIEMQSGDTLAFECLNVVFK